MQVILNQEILNQGVMKQGVVKQEVVKQRNLLLGQIQTDLTRLSKHQERDEEALKNIIRLNISKELLDKKIEEYNRNIDKRNKEIQLLKQKDIDVRSGKYDEEMNKEASKNKVVASTRNNDITKRKKQAVVNKKEKLDKIYKKQKNEIDENRYNNREYNYGYDQYLKAVDTLPDYMRENLKEMSNNKGYIWRSCWFLGGKERERNAPVILFEKIKGNITRIHEIDSYQHKIFEKYGKEKKVLISTKRRNNYIKR
jgi:hypothetical protein